MILINLYDSLILIDIILFYLIDCFMLYRLINII